jgi:hypothetical protein
MQRGGKQRKKPKRAWANYFPTFAKALRASSAGETPTRENRKWQIPILRQADPGPLRQ